MVYKDDGIMKALMFFYLAIWLFVVYYAGAMIYKLLGDDSIPLFLGFGLLFVIKWIANYKKLKL